MLQELEGFGGDAVHPTQRGGGKGHGVQGRVAGGGPFPKEGSEMGCGIGRGAGDSEVGGFRKGAVGSPKKVEGEVELHGCGDVVAGGSWSPKGGMGMRCGMGRRVGGNSQGSAGCRLWLPS